MMSKSEKIEAGAVSRSSLQGQVHLACSCKLPLLLILLLLLLIAGCRRDMQDQPKIKPLRGASFFSDRLGSRQPIEGTIPRGYLRSDTEFFTGKKAGAQGASTTTEQRIVGTQANAPANAQTGAQSNSFPDDVDTFPLPVTQEVVARGRARYAIFCSACHGLTGNGDGMIVRRGFRRAASFNDDRLRQAPVGHFFDAITNGWGAMPSYAAQIPVQDRWAIIAYIRALQVSQQNIAAAAGASPSPAPSTSPASSPASGGHQ
jgi:mono/diheme cytochrome c family protein